MDKPLFRRWFNRSQVSADTIEVQAERGNADAQFYLGLQYANPGGAAQDYAQAAQWYSRAAGQNHALAQFNLGMMYASGQGVRRNDTEAEMWFGKAAELGDAGAQYNLGLGHYRASIQGLPQNMPESRIEAYKWFFLAAAQGYRSSDSARATVALKMTRQDVVEATQRVDAFITSNHRTPATP